MIVRASTALVGGYAAAAGSASLGARLLPVSRVEATAWGMIFSFLVFAVLGLWAFHEARLTRVLGFTWGLAAFCSVATAWMGARP